LVALQVLQFRSLRFDAGFRGRDLRVHFRDPGLKPCRLPQHRGVRRRDREQDGDPQHRPKSRRHLPAPHQPAPALHAVHGSPPRRPSPAAVGKAGFLAAVLYISNLVSNLSTSRLDPLPPPSIQARGKSRLQENRCHAMRTGRGGREKAGSPKPAPEPKPLQPPARQPRARPSAWSGYRIRRAKPNSTDPSKRPNPRSAPAKAQITRELSVWK